MSHRPIEMKQRRRVAKAIRRKSLPARMDLVQWLIDNGHAKTKREARELILARRVKADSHVLGVDNIMAPAPTAYMDLQLGREPKMVEQEVVAQYIDANLRSRIMVLPDADKKA